eukprot:COSAG02_NODE_453_length_22025_cov_16.179923_6_plen_90_part_00
MQCTGLEEVELDPAGSGSEIGGYPIPPGLYDHLSTARTPIAIVFFVLAGLQLFRATVSCVIKERLQKCGFLFRCLPPARSTECPGTIVF